MKFPRRPQRPAVPFRTALVLGAVFWGATSLVYASPEQGYEEDPLVRLVAEREQSKAAGPAPTAAPAPSDAPVASTESGSPTPPTDLPHRIQDSAAQMILTAMNFLGVRYSRGGNSAEEGFDCSGFTRHVFENSLGFRLPRRADEQASAPGLVKVSKGELRPGDLVFFNTMRRTFSHVGIYLGEGKFIHAPRSGANVRVESMALSYWSKRFTGARRLDQSVAQAMVRPAAPMLSLATPVGPQPNMPADTAYWQ